MLYLKAAFNKSLNHQLLFILKIIYLSAFTIPKGAETSPQYANHDHDSLKAVATMLTAHPVIFNHHKTIMQSLPYELFYPTFAHTGKA